MKKSILFSLSLFIFILAIVFFLMNCHKVNAPEDIGYAIEQAMSEKTFSDASNIVSQAATISTSSQLNYRTTHATIGGCATIYRDSALISGVMIDTLIINFGQTDCQCSDGRYRRGQIIETHSGHYYDSGYTHTITFNNYYQDDNKVTGYKTITNMGHNNAGQPIFDISVSGSVALSNGGTISVNYSRVKTWIGGYLTPKDPNDDSYSLSGSGTLTRANGNVVHINILDATPLITVYGCRWIEAGTMFFTLPNGKTHNVNFGNAPACDPNAVVTLANGTTKNIVLP